MGRDGRVGATVLVGVLVAHLVTLYIPGSPDQREVIIPHLDKAIHLIAFGVPAFLLSKAVNRWWPVALLAVHAPVSELIQHHFVPFRAGEVADAVADLAGVAAGVLAAQWGRRRSRHSPPVSPPSPA